MDRFKIWIPVGALGAYFPDESIAYAISQDVDAIACDAGSTDSGPYYLGTGASTKPRGVIKADLRKLITASHQLGVPLVIGSCGTCGSNMGVDWTRDICLEIAREENRDFRLATIYCEQDKQYLKKRLREGRVAPLEGAPPISEEVIDSCTRVVGVMGAEPFMEALENGADIILGGRATDTALMAALPLMKGFSPGPVWHGAKIVECGGQCTTGAASGGAIVHYDETGFEVEASTPDGVCTPYSVSAHMLYETANPFELREPSGLLKTQNAVYTAIDDRRVRVEGSEFEKKTYTIKLEGAALAGYQTTIMAGMRSPDYIANIDKWQTQLTWFIQNKVSDVLKLDEYDYDIQFRRFGLDGVTNAGLPEGAPQPHEICVMMMVTARTQELASDVVKLASPYVLHMPLTMEEEIPAFAFPYSPAQVDRGPVYEFKLHHVVEPDSYQEMVRITYMDVKKGKAGK